MSSTTTKATVDISKLENLADKVRAKAGTQAEMTVDEMATAVENIPNGDIIQQLETRQDYSNIQINDDEVIRFYPQSSYYYSAMPITRNGTSVTLEPSLIQTARIVVKFQINSLRNDNRFIATGNISSQFPCILVDSANSPVMGWRLNNNWKWLSLNYTLSVDTWYYMVLYLDQSFGMILSLYDELGTLIKVTGSDNSDTFSSTQSANIVLGGLTSDSGAAFKYGQINYSETFIEIDGTIVWGKSNSKTQNIGIFNFDFTDPTQFTKVGYIESSNGAYIDVDFIRNGSTNISCEMDIEPIPTTGNGAVFAAFGVDYAHAGGACALQQHSNKWALLEPGVSYHDFGSVSAQKYNVTLSLSGNTATLSGDISSTVTSSNYSTSATFNNAKTRLACSTYGSLRAQKYKLRREGVEEYSLYACYHTQTGLVGFFDETHNKFIQNMGSGTFVKGSDVD